MNILESLVYGLVSGICEVLPISSRGHSYILKLLFGNDGLGQLRDLFIHIGAVVALLFCCRTYFQRLGSHLLYGGSSGRRHRRTANKSTYDLKLIVTSAIPMLIGLLMYRAVDGLGNNIGLLGLLFVLGGVIVLVPEFFPQGNKSASKFSSLEGLLMGILTAFSVVPGISRIGLIMSFALLRGADKHHALNWSLALSVPALILICCIDLLGLFTLGIYGATFLNVLGCILAGICSFAATWGGIVLMRFIAFRGNFSFFAFISWGIALLSFIFYLIV